MKRLTFMVILSGIILNSNSQNTNNYPVSKKENVVDNYFGTEIADPYRWLENDTSAETGDWVKRQNAFTNNYLDAIPYRNNIKERLTKIWNYEKFSTPFKEGNYFFYYKNSGVQNQSVLYIQSDLKSEAKVFLDPNTLSNDGTLSLGEIKASNDGKYMAYTTSKAGSDWNEIMVREIPSGKELKDHLKWIKFSDIAWKGNGFYYSCYDTPEKGSELSAKNEYHKVYYHKIGTDQSEDQLIFENKKFPLRNYTAQTTDDEKYLILYETETTDGNSIFIKDLTAEKSDFVKIADGFNFEYSVIEDINGKLLIKTSDNAGKYKLIAVDPKKPERSAWITILPEKEKEVLTSVLVINNKIIATYMKDAASKSFVYDLNGKLIHEIILPTIGTVGGFSGKKDEPFAFYSFTSFTYPNTIFKYDIESNKSEVHQKPTVDFKPEDYETKQVFYTSKDGTKIPMFIVHKKGLKLDGNNPTLLYGYGGFNISLTPSFGASRLILLENNGVLAIANLRGGGEYGEAWHKAGTVLQKQNVFDDFIAAAEYLIKEKYTTPAKLAIQGGSNGGLLVGACMTQRPELFKVAFPAVGVMDMLRFHKFTIGWSWVGDYGSSDDATQFKYILGYSPLHNLKKGINYPATMVTTADHDDRVVPAHSFKFAATLQEKQTGNNPTLIRIDSNAGHGAGKPTAKVIEEYTDIYSFMFYNMGIKAVY
ncbi:MAG: prolyl oligopeptidase family serine peptidase [Bacteroidota bacterium]